MVALINFQPIHRAYHHTGLSVFPDNPRSASYRRRRWDSGRGNRTLRCGIAEPSGQPAPMGQKTKYNDGLFEKVFMSLFARKMEKFGGQKGRSSEVKRKGWFGYDYESFVELSRRVMQGRNRPQQQQVVREVLLSMLPPAAPAQVVEAEVNGVKQKSGVLIKKCRYLENSGCVGMCVNMCKLPTQDFFTKEFGLPLTMNPNFEDMSCEMVYGQEPPPYEQDPVAKQPCLADICSMANPRSSVCHKLQA
ncbi:unnamed protein product [Cuscuta epithymum]|uniref:Beta-carotene isomerase D27-like C-terminal domain-containing protein n=1 Tax=Cuscuta epithymum TaxID=186058 RepID=A0AAV0D0W4_9ASTE|nr:unnamed protein product [Cuscuta epithymum]